MIKKAIFGGTFDPIHNGHIQVAYEAMYKLKLDKVIFMPSGNPPHKQESKVTDSNIRCRLVEAAIQHEKNFDISYYEVNKCELSYTYETVKHFKQSEPNTEWYFIAGADCLIDIDSWYNVEGILDYCDFVVFNRTEYSIEDILIQKAKVEKIYNKKIIFIDEHILQISSTDIRNKIKNNRSASYLVPHDAYKLIKELNLYK
ncbi:nicotinate-nucleotide adenylyltransferase [Clostridium tepidiprofundi DSM 19306]|uniref:Probable nicotinate-nucleotide adenylyltransferase n=1 Tax=Clostridium tepidiprofundi DSM 19306 TaxID=1121338 RepID=A0A151B3K9_9CLOT|nr:nicotinate-nucleotide adenylyltransferase [Clostridium tepidiprofundi]KYH34495.1 nicotinate-nucleotide adenylyltransferase [Clostridium tepidiprofundi DSM 19306]